MKKNIFKMILALMGFMIIISCGTKKTDEKQDETKAAGQEGTPAKKVYKIGLTQIVDHPALNDSKKGFLDALKDAGVEVETEDQIANGEISTQNLIVKQFIDDRKDLIFAIATPSAQAAANSTDTIPIVFASVSDPEGASLTGRGNVTGTSGQPDVEENLQLMKKVFPNAKKIGVIYNTSEQNSVFQVEYAKKIAAKYGLEIVEEGVTSAPEFILALDKMARSIDVFYAMQDNTLSSSFPSLLDKMNELKIPIFGANSVYTDRGALISQGTTDYDVGYRAGVMAVKILKEGKKPSEIAIETVKLPKVFINKKNLELLKVTIPEDVLKEATIIE